MRTSRTGATLVYVVVVLVAVAVFSAVLFRMLSASCFTELTANAAHRARYMAEAGLNYARAQGTNSLDALAVSGSERFDLGESGSFTVTVGAMGLRTAGLYPVESVGLVNEGTAWESSCRAFAEVSPVAEEESAP